jgi:hypothetical protein
MKSPIRSIALSGLLMASLGCGYMAQVNKKVEYQTVALGPRRGDLWKYAEAGCPTCTEAFLKSNWGEPSSRAVDETGTDVWTYHNGLKWVGASPVVLIPLPLFVPSGKEKIQFGIKNGQITFVKHETVRRMFLYLPIAHDNNITAGLYQGTAPISGCVFKQAP